MNLQDKSQVAYLHIPPLMWKLFRVAMLNARQAREEVIGFFFCQRYQLSNKKIRYVPKAWVVPSPECYELQSDSGLVLKQSFHQYLFDTYLGDRFQTKPANLHEEYDPNDFFESSYQDYWLDSDRDMLSDRDSEYGLQSDAARSWGFPPLATASRSDRTKIDAKPIQKPKLDIVHIHTHFGDEAPAFSYIDDRYEAEYAKFLSASCSHKPRLISGVFDESLEQCQFRIWDRQGIYHAPINFSHDWFLPQKSSLLEEESELMFARQKVFGTGVQEQLSGLKVVLIGCGGIGAVFAEQLARLGVKYWTLIDPDRLETVNLNRMPAANLEMVDRWWHKVDYVKWLIKRVFKIGSHVQAMPISVEDDVVKDRLANADLIVVATDNHRSRQVAQELALKYVIPLICLGTHIDTKQDTIPRMYCRVTIPPLGGDWCLMCGNIINLQQAALESAPSAIADVPHQRGYVQGIDDPAVYWLNSICASTAVGIIHGMVSGFIDADAGLDWIYDFPTSQWLKTDTEHLTTPDCFFCGLD